jgi:hypothetical protein
MYTKKDAAYGGYKVANLDREHPLLQWTQACNEFCAMRNRVNSLIKERLASPDNESGNQNFVSQCSTAQLIVLELDMTKELERLLSDINRRKGASFKKKLADHVTILHTWNQRAQRLLNLAAQSTC